MKASSEPGHPLFLPEDEDDDPVNVSEIQITRMENGQPVFYPRVFPAAELQSLEQVQSELGGGTYILISRHDGRITTRRKYVIPGKPKPMYDEGRQEPPATTTQAAPATIDPMAMMMGGQGGGFMPLIMLMMQQQQQAADRQMQMFLAMMQGTRESSAEDKAAARAEMAQNVERERINSERMITLMQSAMTNKGGGSGEDFTRGVEFMRSFAAQQIGALQQQAKGGGDMDWSSILETLGQVMQGVGMLKNMGGGGLHEGVTEVAQVAEAAQ